MTDEQSRDGLLACPRCGGEAAIETRDMEPQGDPWYGRKMEMIVLCKCGLCLFDECFHEGFVDSVAAIAAWNTRVSRPSREPTLGSHTEGVGGADRALVASDEARSGLHPTGFDHGESKCDATCLNCAGSGQMAVMTGTRRDMVAYYIPCPNGPAPDLAKAAWGLVHAVEGFDSIPRACGILRWALVAESER